MRPCRAIDRLLTIRSVLHHPPPQGFCLLDDVQFVNGTQLGRRAVVQVDQGLNLRVPLPGGKSVGLTGGLFNRLSASYTKFMQMPGLPKLTYEDVYVKRKVGAVCCKSVQKGGVQP